MNSFHLCFLFFLADADFQPALAGTFFGLVSMGLFNIIVIADATAQVHKWCFAANAEQKKKR